MAIAFVQQTARFSASAASSVTSAALTTTFGNTGILTVSSFLSASIPAPTITDSKGNAGVVDVSTPDINGKIRASVGSIPFITAAGAGHTWTVNLAAGSYCEGNVSEFSGLLAAPFDVSGGQDAAPATTSLSPTTGTTAQAAEAVIGCLVTNIGSTNTHVSDPPAGFTSIGVQANDTATIGYEGAYAFVNAIGAQSATWSFDTNPGLGAGVTASVATYQSAASSSVVVVQKSTELFADNASSISPSLAGCTAGNTVVLLVSAGTLSAQYTIPAPAGWSTAIAPLGTLSNVYGSSVGIFYKENISAGTQSATVALHGSGTDFASASIIEVSGLALANSLGPTASNSANSGATSGNTGTTAAIGARNGMAFVIGHPDGGAGSVSALTPLPPTGYTDIDNEPSNASHVCYDFAYKRVTDGATQSASWSWTSSGLYAAAIAVFYDAPIITSSLPSLGTGIYQPPMAGLF